MENHHFQWENQLEIAIFNSYVKLPEGISHVSWVPQTNQPHGCSPFDSAGELSTLEP
jgi:hypothetical protein